VALPFGVAVAVAALAMGVIAARGASGGVTRPGANAPSLGLTHTASVRPGPKTNLSLVVPTHTSDAAPDPTANPSSLDPIHNGDIVAASGRVRVSPDGTAEFCPPVAMALGGMADDTCTDGIPTIGVDASELAMRAQVGIYTVGQAYIEGTWRDRTITVTQQGPPRNDQGLPDERPPCSAPSSGWQTGGADPPTAFSQYIKEHPDDFSGWWLGYPLHKPGTEFTRDELDVSVATVGVVGDLDAAQRELRALYSGNLCLTKAPHSATELHQAFNVLLKHSSEVGLDGVAIGFNSRVPNLYTVIIQPDLVDEPLWTLIQQVGPDLVDVQPWLRKVI
jgi:hypothetical protein